MLNRIFLTGLLIFTFGCDRKVTFSAMAENYTISVAEADAVCEQVSRGRYNLDECRPTSSQKCVGQKYGRVTCYTKVDKTCEEGGLFSVANQCKNSDVKKCARTKFAGRTCYRLINKTCSDFDLYDSKNSCDSSKSRIQICESLRKSSGVTCWKKDINRSLFVSEQFHQPVPEKRRVDVLFVNDNSVSMREDQVKMSEKLYSFIGELRNVDWQLGITTTDLSDGPYSSRGRLLNMSDANGEADIKFITTHTPNKEELFRHTIQRQESIDCFETRKGKRSSNCRGLPSGEEQPIGAIVNAISLKDSHNVGFFRDEADLAVVVLTDEDESIPTEASSPIYNPNDVISVVRNVWGAGKQVSVYGIVIEEGDRNCLDEQKNSINDGRQFSVSYAPEVTDLVSATNGLTGSICDADYGPTLRNIGRNIVRVIDQFVLASVPVSGTLSVNIVENGQKKKLASNEYTLNNKTIQLHVRVSPRTELEVNYIPQI